MKEEECDFLDYLRYLQKKMVMSNKGNSLWYPILKKICDCGGEKAKTTHSNWCTKYEQNNNI